MARKRSNGSGSISKLPSGNWRGQLMDGYTADGKRKLISFTAPTKGEVQQKIREYLASKVTDDVQLKNEGEMFSYWADLWYDDYRNQVQASTYSGYKYTLKLLKDGFEGREAAAIKPIDVSRFLDGLTKEGCSVSKVSKCRAMLIQIFDFMMFNDLVTRNSARLAKSIRNLDSSESNKDAFSEYEVKRLLKELPNDKLGHSIRLLLGSGLRVQELLAIQKNDIAEDGSFLEIRRAVKMVDGKAELGTTKSKAGVRVVPIPESYRESARYLREHSGEAFVWCSGQGNLIYGVGTFRKWYYRALKEVGGIRMLPPHCCRHTYVSLLEAHGVPMEQISRLVGHTKISTTNGYLHIQADVLQSAVNALNIEDVA